MPVTETLAALKAVVGIAGVAYSLVKNIDEGQNFKFEEVNRAIFGESIGGMFSSFSKDGIRYGLDKLKEKYATVSFDKDSLNYDMQKAARKAHLVATFFAAQHSLLVIRAGRGGGETSLVDKTLQRVGRLLSPDASEAYLKEVIEYLNREIRKPENAVVSTLSFDDFSSVFDTYRLAVSPASSEQISKLLKDNMLAELEGMFRPLDSPFDREAFDLLKETLEKGWEETAPKKSTGERFVGQPPQLPEKPCGQDLRLVSPRLFDLQRGIQKQPARHCRSPQIFTARHLCPPRNLRQARSEPHRTARANLRLCGAARRYQGRCRRVQARREGA